jgi:hypothetical protein
MLGVVAGMDPAVDPGLRRLWRLERREVIEQLGTQGLVEPLRGPDTIWRQSVHAVWRHR